MRIESKYFSKARFNEDGKKSLITLRDHGNLTLKEYDFLKDLTLDIEVFDRIVNNKVYRRGRILNFRNGNWDFRFSDFELLPEIFTKLRIEYIGKVKDLL